MVQGYRIDSFAEAELAEAVLWYEQETPGVGLRFLETVHEVARHAVEFPRTGSPVPNVDASAGARRFVLKPFPYWLVTIPVGEQLVIVAIASQQRRPNYFHDRLGPRQP